MSERARALEQALRELTAMVRGECPSLLNEDSGGNGDLSYQIEKLLAVDPPPSGASPQATGGYIHHSLTDWIPTPECDCDRCTSARKSAPKPTGGASPQADELQSANVANLREMVGMAGRYRETLLAVRECIVALSPGHRTGYDWNADPLFLTLKEGRALNLINDALKATLASPQAETSEDMGDGWYVTVGRWGESLVTIEQRCLSGNADLTDDDAALIRGAAKHLQAFIGQPAPVSPVEPESSSFEANTASNLLQKVELSTLDRYRNTNQMDVDTWMVRAVASSEPRSEDDLVLLDHVIALLKPTVEPEPPTLEPCAHELDYHNCAECVGPKVEPEPCAWRITSGPLGTWVNPTCVEGAIPAPWGTERAKACHLCGAPLKVEREP